MNEHQLAGEPMPPEGLVDNVKGADLVENYGQVLGTHPDGTSLTHDEWMQRNSTIDPVTGEQHVKWPDNGGYDGKPVEYTSTESYMKDFGGDVDRIGHPSGSYLGAIENGKPAPCETRSLQPGAAHDAYYQYTMTGKELPDGWKITTGRAAPWDQQPGGARQLQFIRDDGKPASISDLLDRGILRGKDKPIGI